MKENTKRYLKKILLALLAGLEARIALRRFGRGIW